MPTTTANTTAEKYAQMRRMPRATRIQQPIVAILAAELNPLITLANTALTNENADAEVMHTVHKVVAAPVRITDEFVNMALVSVSEHGETLGGGIIEKRGVISVFLIDKVLQPGDLPFPIWDRADCIIGVFDQYKIGYYDAGGNKIWNELLYKNTEMLTGEQFADYSGVAVHFSYWQAAAFSANYWPELPD